MQRARDLDRQSLAVEHPGKNNFARRRRRIIGCRKASKLTSIRNLPIFGILRASSSPFQVIATAAPAVQIFMEPERKRLAQLSLPPERAVWSHS
jgi:hypothetical protein